MRVKCPVEKKRPEQQTDANQFHKVYCNSGNLKVVKRQQHELWRLQWISAPRKTFPTTHLFDKFYHVQIPEQAGGTGLGLSICKGIVDAHGGKIVAKNREGGGLVVEIMLPVTVRSEDE